METETDTLNILSDSSDTRAYALSNFSPCRFVLDGVLCESVESFVQAIMWHDDHPNHAHALRLWGKEAKRVGMNAGRQYVHWKRVGYAFGSPAHHALIERAIRAKFEQNHEARELLRETLGLTLTHDTGRPESPVAALPAEIFCDILTRIRDGKPPRYPAGTPEEPILIQVIEEPMGRGFQAHAIIGDHQVQWERGDTKAAAVYELLRSLQSAHSKLTIDFDPCVFG